MTDHRSTTHDVLEQAIRSELLDSGSALVFVRDLHVDVATWRSAARRVARALGRPIQTGISEDKERVWAALTDYPATAEEKARFDVKLREAIAGLPSV